MVFVVVVVVAAVTVVACSQDSVVGRPSMSQSNHDASSDAHDTPAAARSRDGETFIPKKRDRLDFDPTKDETTRLSLLRDQAPPLAPWRLSIESPPSTIVNYSLIAPSPPARSSSCLFLQFWELARKRRPTPI